MEGKRCAQMKADPHESLSSRFGEVVSYQVSRVTNAYCRAL